MLRNGIMGVLQIISWDYSVKIIMDGLYIQKFGY